MCTFLAGCLQRILNALLDAADVVTDAYLHSEIEHKIACTLWNILVYILDAAHVNHYFRVAYNMEDRLLNACNMALALRDSLGGCAREAQRVAEVMSDELEELLS